MHCAARLCSTVWRWTGVKHCRRCSFAVQGRMQETGALAGEADMRSHLRAPRAVLISIQSSLNIQGWNARRHSACSGASRVRAAIHVAKQGKQHSVPVSSCGGDVGGPGSPTVTSCSPIVRTNTSAAGGVSVRWEVAFVPGCCCCCLSFNSLNRLPCRAEQHLQWRR